LERSHSVVLFEWFPSYHATSARSGHIWYADLGAIGAKLVTITTTTTTTSSLNGAFIVGIELAILPKHRTKRGIVS
jgi:hypothetical protein